MVKSVLRDWHSFLHWNTMQTHLTHDGQVSPERLTLIFTLEYNANTPHTWWSSQSWETGTHFYTGIQCKHTSHMMVKSVLRDWYSFLHWNTIQTHLSHDGQVSPERLALILALEYNTNTPQTWWSSRSWETGTVIKYKHTSDMMVKSVLRDWHSFLHWNTIQTHLRHDGQVSPERLALILALEYNTKTPQTWWSSQSWETGTHSCTGIKYKHTTDMMVKSVLRHDGQVSPERLALILALE